jgi:maleate isomerase
MRAELREFVGMLVPSSNRVLEPGLARIAGADVDPVTVLASRVRVVSIDPESNGQFTGELMAAAGALVADARPRGIVWGGTSGGWNGLDADRAIVTAITEATGLPATTTTLATLELVQTHGIRRLGFATPYLEEIDAGIRETYAPYVDEVLTDGLGLSDNISFANVRETVVEEQVRRLAAQGCDAIAVYCTNVGFLGSLGIVERELGVALLDSVAVTYWAAAQFTDHPSIPGGFGRLLTSEERTSS